MQDGAKAITVHLIITLAVFYSVLVSWVFYPCLSTEGGGSSVFFNKFEDTVLFSICVWPAVLFAITLIFIKTFIALPFIILYWFRRFRTSALHYSKKGIFLTVAALLLIIEDPFRPFGFSDSIRNYISAWDAGKGVTVYIFAVFSIYIVPYLSLRFSYPDFRKLKVYRIYAILFCTQIIVYFLAIVTGILF